MVAKAGDIPLLMVGKAGMSPEPEVPRPMLVLLFVHAYVVIPTVLVLVKPMAAVEAPWQTTWLAGCSTCPVGLTVMVKLLVPPEHETPPLVKVGVTAIVATTGDVPVLMAVNSGMFPVPVAVSPMVGSLLVQS